MLTTVPSTDSFLSDCCTTSYQTFGVKMSLNHSFNKFDPWPWSLVLLILIDFPVYRSQNPSLPSTCKSVDVLSQAMKYTYIANESTLGMLVIQYYAVSYF